jgi:hypothetical protein
VQSDHLVGHLATVLTRGGNRVVVRVQLIGVPAALATDQERSLSDDVRVVLVVPVPFVLPDGHLVLHVRDRTRLGNLNAMRDEDEAPVRTWALLFDPGFVRSPGWFRWWWVCALRCFEGRWGRVGVCGGGMSLCFVFLSFLHPRVGDDLKLGLFLAQPGCSYGFSMVRESLAHGFARPGNEVRMGPSPASGDRLSRLGCSGCREIALRSTLEERCEASGLTYSSLPQWPILAEC